QRDVDGRSDAVVPGRGGEHGEQVAVQVVHGVVVGFQLACPGEVAGLDHLGGSPGQRAADPAHLGHIGGDLGGEHRVRVAAPGGRGDVLGEIPHAFDGHGGVQAGQDDAQVGGDGCLEREEGVHLLLGGGAELVDAG